MKTSEVLQKAVEKYRKGDEASFNELYQMSYGYLYTCAKHIVQQEELTQDMLQETYLEISKSILQLEKAENFLNWAAMIANRKCFAYLKKQNAIHTVQADEDLIENVMDDEAFIPEEILQNQEKQRLMREIIDGLSAEQRLCIIGYYYNEMKQEDMAREFEMPLNTVKTHLRRAKEEIRKRVIDLDKKKGTRLYCLAPFLVLFFNMEAEACTPLPLESVMKTKLNQENGTPAKVAKMSMKAKAVTGGLILAGVVGIGAFLLANQGSSPEPEGTQELVAESVEESVSEESSQESEVVESEPLEEVHLYDGVTPLAISGMYESYCYANAGVIPVCKDEKWGLVNFDNEILVPFEYEDCCAMPNDEGQTYFGNPGDYRVFDSEGKELFRTEETITAVNDGVVLTETDNEAGYHFGYYTLDGATLYEAQKTGTNMLFSDYSNAVGFSEGYGFFRDTKEARIDNTGLVHSVFDTYYAKELAQAAEMNANSSIDRVGISEEGYAYPLGAASQGYYIAKSGSDGFYGDRQINCYYLYDVDGNTRHTLAVSSVYRRAGHLYTESVFGWSLQGYYEDGVIKYNYDTLVTIHLKNEEKPVSYLLDMTKLEQKSMQEFEAAYDPSTRSWEDFDWSPITDEAIVAEAEDIDINGEKYWLINKDGQWGYIDHEGNVVGMFQDAAEFNEGKAVIIEDGIAYWIDENLEKTVEIGPAESVVNFGDVTCVTYADGSEVFLSY